MRNNDEFPQFDAIYSPLHLVKITDKRDIDEINRRKKKNTCHPKRDELYSVNPNFNGIYSDEENR